MRDKGFLLSLLVLATLLATASAPAQPKARATGKGKAPAAEASKPAPGADAPASGESTASEGETPSDGAEPTRSGDAKLDEPPPKRKGGEAGVRPSPLNPEPNEFPQGQPKRAPLELAKLMSDIAALRSRVAALTTSLFSSKLKIYVRTEGDDARIKTFAVTLDGGVIYRAPARFIAEESRIVYEHSVAPGHHVLGVEIERYDAHNKAYKTWQTTKFSVLVPEKQLVEADLLVEDDSDMGEDFPDDQDGEYDLEVRLRAKVVD